MRLTFHFCGLPLALVLLGIAAATGVSAQVRRGGPLPNRGPGVRPERTAPGKREPGDKMERRAAEFERFQRMSPEMRQKALDRLPPERRARIEQGMRQYESMNPQNRERLRNFENMPQEQREAIRQNFRRMQELPTPRRNLVRREMQELRKLGPEERETRMQSEAFRKRFNIQEQGLIRDTVANLPDPE